MEKQNELAQLQGEHHSKVLEAQKLQRALDRKEQELADLQQTKDQLEVEMEDLQQQKKKGDKALNVKKQNQDCQYNINSIFSSITLFAHSILLSVLSSHLSSGSEQSAEKAKW